MRNSVYRSPTELEIQQDDLEVAFPVDTVNFEGGVTVTDDGNNKVTVTVTAVSDPFEFALYSDGCDLLFEKLPNGQVNLLLECI